MNAKDENGLIIIFLVVLIGLVVAILQILRRK